MLRASIYSTKLIIIIIMHHRDIITDYIAEVGDNDVRATKTVSQSSAFKLASILKNQFKTKGKKEKEDQ